MHVLYILSIPQNVMCSVVSFTPLFVKRRCALATLPGGFYRGCLAEALIVVFPKRFRFADCVSFNSYSSVMYIYHRSTIIQDRVQHPSSSKV